MDYLLRQYGEMLFDTSKSGNMDEQIYNDIIAVQKTIEMHRNIFQLLEPATKHSFASEFTLIAETFLKKYYEVNNILAVKVVTSVELEEQLEHKLKAKLENITEKKIILLKETEPQMLGGIRLEYDEKEIDGSLEKHLARLKNELMGGE